MERDGRRKRSRASGWSQRCGEKMAEADNKQLGEKMDQRCGVVCVCVCVCVCTGRGGGVCVRGGGTGVIVCAIEGERERNVDR